MGTTQNAYDAIYGPVVEVEVKSPYKEEFQRVERLVAEVDSGANVTAINNAVARNLGLPPAGSRKIDTAGGKRNFPAYSCNLTIKGLARKVEGVVIIGIQNIEAERALLGRDIIDFLIVNLDGPRQLLTITDPSQHACQPSS